MSSQEPTTAPGIEVSGLGAGYGHRSVLAGASVDVPQHQVAAVLGRSGCGKTTLLRAIAGFVRPTAGVIRLEGRTVANGGVWVPPERRNVGLVPQEGALFPHLDVAGNVGFGLARRTRPERQLRRERVAQLLDFVGLPDCQRMRPHELSGGMQQRVALARALARSPRIVLLDEPFSALDAQLRRELRMQVRQLLLSTGAAVMIVTHDEEEAATMADVVYELADGRIVLTPTRPIDPGG